MISLAILAFCRGVLGVVFAFSLSGKLSNLSGFVKTIARFEVGPARFHHPLAWAMLLGELLTMVLMVGGGRWLVPGFLLALALLGIFCVAIASALVRKKTISCHCFGSSAILVSSLDLFRNGGFLICAGIGLFLPASSPHTNSIGVLEWGTLLLAASFYVAVFTHLPEIKTLLS